MRYIEITGIERPVSVMGLGTTSKIFTPAGDDRVAELIDAYLAVGGNCIDTAHIYGSGESEKALGRWFEESRRREDILGLSLPVIAVAPFEASAPAKLRLALRAFTQPGLPVML